MKTCSCCKEVKSLEDFNYKIKSKNILQSACRICEKKRKIVHYNKNAAYYIKKAKRLNLIWIEEYKEYKKSLFCTDCGYSFKEHPSVCDFHHLENKDFDIASIKASRLKLAEELKKCIPLCANCHRIRHEKE